MSQTTSIEWTDVSWNPVHGNHARGEKNARWNAGHATSSHGYTRVRVGKSHPLADPNGYAYEHHLVVVSALGRMLADDEVVHHRNGDKTADALLHRHPQEHAFGNYEPGRWAWVLSDVEALPKPVPWRGSQGTFDVPDDLTGHAEPAAQGTLL